MKQGFSIVEFVIIITIIGLLTAIASGIIVSGVQTQRILGEQSTAVANADRAMNTIAKTIRELRSGDNGGYAVISASATEFSFYADIDTDDATEKVRYYLDNEAIYAEYSEPTGTPVTYTVSHTDRLAGSIVNQSFTNNAMFTYFSSVTAGVTPTPMTAPIDTSAITMMGLQFDVNVNPDVAPNTVTVNTYIRPRNIADL